MSDSSTASSATESRSASALHRSLPVTRQRARYATMAIFFIADMIYPSWGVHVPTVLDKFALSPGMLSFVLLAVADGSIFAMLTNASWITGGAGIAIFGALILATPYLAAVRRARAVWLRHGGCGGALLAHGLAPELHLILASAVSLIVLLVSLPTMLPHVLHHDEHTKVSSSNRWKSGALWALRGGADCAHRGRRHVRLGHRLYARCRIGDAVVIERGLRGVFGGMTAGRFGGDAVPVRARFGAPQLIFGSAGLAFIGIVMALVFPNAFVTITGLTLMGLGLANMMPVRFAAAKGLAQMAGLAYFGLLFGPVLIGGAQITNPPIGLCVVRGHGVLRDHHRDRPRIFKRWKI